MNNGDLRVTLVQTSRWTIYTPPYAIALLTGNLRSRGFQVTPRDYDVELYHHVNEEDKKLWLSENADTWNDEAAIRALADRYPEFQEWCINDILATNPHIVGFSVKCHSRTYTLILAEALKKRAPHIYVIFGGPEINNGVERFLKVFPFIDAVAMQEADVSFPQFLEKYAASNMIPQPEIGFAFRGADGEIVFPGNILEAPNVDSIPFADYSDFDFSKYQNPHAITLLLSRGCINRCSFCSEAPSFLRYRYFPAKRVYEEIRHVASHSNVKQPLKIYFNDSLINGNFEQMDGLADYLIADPIPGFQFGGMMLMRDRMSDDLIRKLAKAGLSEVFFGMETGSAAVIEIMRKKFKLETAERILRVAHESGITTTVSIIFGHPGETELEYFNSIEFMKKIYPNVDKFLINVLGIYGDSNISRNLEKYGITTLHPRDWVGDDGHNTIDIRLNRKINAINLFWEKVGDIGDFASLGLDDRQPFIRFKEYRNNQHKLPSLTLSIKEALEQGRMSKTDRLDGCYEHIAFDPSSRKIRVRGWAIQRNSYDPAPGVALILGSNHVVGICKPTQSRRDVMKAKGTPKALNSGWEAEIDVTLLRTMPLSEIQAIAFDLESGQYSDLRCLITEFPVQ